MKNTPPVVQSLNVYPVKSLRGIPVSSWQVAERGFEFDRRWMVVDQNHRFITQREKPGLALISTAISGDALVLDAPGAGKMELPLRHNSTKRVSVEVWEDVVDAAPADDRVTAWISAYLGLSASLVYMPDDTRRSVSAPYSANKDPYAFSDAFPFLILSEGSLQELNRRMPKPLLMNRFRPNIVISQCEPFEEDRWRYIRIGEVGFRIVKPCSRCATTTVDQASAEVGKEPLRTLATFRKKDGEVYFGQNAIQTNKGRIEVGSAVEVLETAQPLFPSKL